jgi:hypothetical protein
MNRPPSPPVLAWVVVVVVVVPPTPVVSTGPRYESVQAANIADRPADAKAALRKNRRFFVVLATMTLPDKRQLQGAAKQS